MSPRRKTTTVTLGDQALNALNDIAAERTKERRASGDTRKTYAGDIIREAVEEYLQRRGYSIEVGVDRGGYRGVKED